MIFMAKDRVQMFPSRADTLEVESTDSHPVQVYRLIHLDPDKRVSNERESYTDILSLLRPHYSPIQIFLAAIYT